MAGEFWWSLNHLIQKEVGTGARIRTLTNGFGDRCATIDTTPIMFTILYINALYVHDTEQMVLPSRIELL